MANVNVKTHGFGTMGFHDRIALGRSEVRMFLYTLRTRKFSPNPSSFTYDLKASGWRLLCTKLAIVIHFESIWSRVGTHFGNLFGTRLAQKDPRLAQEDHQEPQSSENLQLQKP